jgi:hypothetical protein
MTHPARRRQFTSGCFGGRRRPLSKRTDQVGRPNNEDETTALRWASVLWFAALFFFEALTAATPQQAEPFVERQKQRVDQKRELTRNVLIQGAEVLGQAASCQVIPYGDAYEALHRQSEAYTRKYGGTIGQTLQIMLDVGVREGATAQDVCEGFRNDPEGTRAAKNFRPADD